jgi:hypothetical protein
MGERGEFRLTGESYLPIPTPNKLKRMITKKEIELSQEQILEYKLLFESLLQAI